MDNLAYLRGIVDRIAAPFKAHPNVKAIASVGSVALGLVDDISDTDTIIYCDPLPTEAEFIELRDRVIDEFGNWYWRDAEHGYGCYSFINGVKCDFGVHPRSQVDEIMDDVQKNLDLDAGKQKLMSGMVNALALHGDEIINDWRRRAREDYPDALAEKLVREHLKFRPLWIVRDMAAGRGDTLWYYEEVVKLQNNLMGVLVGLNRMYHPMDYKHMDFIVAQMQHKPQNLAQRLRDALRAEPTAGAEQTAQLIEEVMELVEEHMPQIDVKARRDWFRTPAMRWQLPIRD